MSAHRTVEDAWQLFTRTLLQVGFSPVRLFERGSTRSRGRMGIVVAALFVFIAGAALVLTCLEVWCTLYNREGK